MRNLRILTFSFILIGIVIIILWNKTENELYSYFISVIILLFFVLRQIIYRSNIKDYFVRIKLKTSGKWHLFFHVLSFIISIGLISNIWFDFVNMDFPSRLIWAVFGLNMLMDFIYGFDTSIVLLNNRIAVYNSIASAKWEKISGYEINNSELTIRTPYTPYKISFDQIPDYETNKVISILNEKLHEVFKGTIEYNGSVLRIIKNKA